MATGTVKWFSDEKGFGFITPDDQGKDLFVHHTGIAGNGFRSLPEGAKVSYDAEVGPCYAGDATIAFYESPVEELTRLTPEEMIGGYWQEVGTNWRAGTTLERRNLR